MKPLPTASKRFELNYKSLLAQSGLKNNQPKVSLSSWGLSTTGLFDFSEESDPQNQIPRTQAETAPERKSLESNWSRWLTQLFPRYVSDAFASFHEDFWEWVWSIREGERSSPFIAIWPRSFAKSTSVELACVAVAARKTRKYGLYICATQDRADDHVQNVATMLESTRFAELYPDAAKRMVGKFGNQLGWRRNRLRTDSGFTLDAIGLDTAARGVKLDEMRPDFLIFDDLDDKYDGVDATAKKIRTLTHDLLPAGSRDMTVVGAQNLIHGDGIFAQLADGRADFLVNRIVSGPYPALESFAYEIRDGKAIITGGEPVWAVMDIPACQALMDEIGLSAFRRECQHDLDVGMGGIFEEVVFRYCEPEEVPDLVKVVVWVDPAVTNKDSSDAQGIQAGGLGPDRKTFYMLWSWEKRSSPLATLKLAILKGIELGASSVGVESDQGGDTWQSVYREAVRELLESGEIEKGARIPSFQSAKAGEGHGPKVHRASKMLTDYEHGNIVHVRSGTQAVLDRALRRFPVAKPYDLVDSEYWVWWDLGRYKPGDLKDQPRDFNIKTTHSPGKPGLLGELSKKFWDAEAQRGS